MYAGAQHAQTTNRLPHFLTVIVHITDQVEGIRSLRLVKLRQRLPGLAGADQQHAPSLARRFVEANKYRTPDYRQGRSKKQKGANADTRQVCGIWPYDKD